MCFVDIISFATASKVVSCDILILHFAFVIAGGGSV